jgi:branched-chain amino acid aminotransferase
MVATQLPRTPIASVTRTSGPEATLPTSVARAAGIVYVDGKFSKPSEATVSVFDHGLLYGDGVFEGIRIYNGRIFKLDRHIDRMYRSADGIALDPGVTPPQLRQIIIETAARSHLRDAYLRVLFTRGPGDLGLDPRRSKHPSVIVICSTINSYHGKAETGLKLVVARLRRTPPVCFDPTVKSLNYLNNVLAKAEANARRADDALLLDLEGNIAEASGENVFVVRDGTLYSPPTTTNLGGITRETIIELSAGIVPFESRPFDVPFLVSGEEAFLTGTGAEVLPVIAVEDAMVGNGAPGPITRRLQAAYFELVRSTGTPVPYQ